MTNFEQHDDSTPPPITLGGSDTNMKVTTDKTDSGSSQKELNLLAVSDSNTTSITNTNQPDTARAAGMAGNSELLAMLGDPLPDAPRGPGGDTPPKQPTTDAKPDAVTLLKKVEQADEGAKNGNARIADVDLKQKALNENKKIEIGADGKPKLSDKPPTREERTQYMKDISDHFAALAAPVQARREYAQLLQSKGQFADAEKVLKEAKQAADKLPLAQMQAQVDMPEPKLARGFTKADVKGYRDELIQAELSRRAIIGPDGPAKLPIKTRQDLGFLYAGVAQQPGESPDPTQKLDAGKTTAFSPQLAAVETAEAARLTEGFLKKNPFDKSMVTQQDHAPMLNRMNLLSDTVGPTLPKPDPTIKANLGYVQQLLDAQNMGSDRPIRK